MGEQARGWDDPRLRRRVARIAMITLAVGLFIAQWVGVILNPEGDFYLHWVFGWRFRLGAFLYAGGMHRPYPPFWALVCTPLTVLPSPLMRAILYPIGFLPLVLLLAMLTRLTSRRLPLAYHEAFWSITFALILCFRFLVREVPECGVNLTILALSWGGIFLWSRRRECWGGLSLGLAVALKCTPALFVAYFAWKRQWRMVWLTTVAALVFTVLPVLWMGSASYAQHMRFWLATLHAGATEPHPVRGVLGDEEPYNLSLRPALGRFLVHLPPEHKGYPWRLDVLDLDPIVAGRLVKIAMGSLLLAVALILGRGVPRRDGLGVAWEAAAVSLLMLLFSPITWRQHCVAAIPACFLLARTAIARGLPRGMIRLVVIYAAAVDLLDRGLIGPTLTLRLDSLGITAWALLILLAATIWGRALALREEEQIADAGRRDVAESPRGPVSGRVPIFVVQPSEPAP